MERFKKLSADVVFVCQVLIVFVLLFEDKIVAPALLQSFGRLHPLMLHMPIGLLIVAVILLYTRRYFEAQGVDSLIGFLLHLTALSASVTTLMGLFLALEGTFGDGQLSLHKWFGVALSFVCWGLMVIRRRENLLKPAAVAGVVILIFTGHFGASLTHGENFVWAPLATQETRAVREINDSTTLFTAVIEPIIEAKCQGCHNPSKAKGKLVLTSVEGIVKGGETGPLWWPGDHSRSLLVERLTLPVDHDDHMPPKDKAQLSEDEITFIMQWIDRGADMQRKLGEVKEHDTLGVLASVIIPRYQRLAAAEPFYKFAFVSADKLEGLSKPNRSVVQIARNEPAVHADFFLQERYAPGDVEELLAVKEQLISINLSRMPVKDAELATIARFSNLESLNLNYTDVTGTGLQELKRLKKLRSISLSGTKVDIQVLKSLAASGVLEEVYLWNTELSPADVDALRKEFPGIAWDVGFIPDTTEILQLNPPMSGNKAFVLNPDEKVVLKHNLPGTEIRYSVDGTEPDSINSAVFTDGLSMDHYASIKARAFKEGWLSSDVASYFYFRKGYAPDSIYLETAPDERFPGDGAITLFDGLKGLPDYYRHPAWIAFRENDLVLKFSFTKDIPTVRSITLSFAHHAYYICLPPDEMELWGGDDPDNMTLIASIDPPELPRPRKPHIEGVAMEVPPSSYKHYKLVARPTRKLADGNPSNRRLWLMVDEIFVN